MSATQIAEAANQAEAWITGIGLVSSLGEGADVHWARLTDGPVPNVDEERYAPYVIHPLEDVDFSSQIERKSDLRQMGRWQRIGVYTAGLALQDAGLKGNPELLDKTDLIVAAGNGERDEETDTRILRALAGADGCPDASGATLNRLLQNSVRPTLYLAQLSNLLAGNIQIVHGVSGSSRTYKGEEMAGVSAVEDAVRRIWSGQGQLFLVGGAFNAERADLGLVYELCGTIWHHPFRSVWRRAESDGGFVLGSIGAFLVLEEAAHARARGRRPYAKVSCIHSGGAGAGTSANVSSNGLAPQLDQLASRHDGPLCVLSGASGVEPATTEELGWLHQLSDGGLPPVIRAYATMLGHSVEAHFPAGSVLAALAVSRRAFYAPFDDSGREQVFDGRIERVLVTGRGHWRGEGCMLVEWAGTR